MKPKVNKLPLSTRLAHGQRHELLKMQEDGMKFSDPYILSATEAAKEERKTRLHIEKWAFDKSFLHLHEPYLEKDLKVMFWKCKNL